MRLEANIAGRVDAMVAECRLDSASVFFCDRRQAVPELGYLHHCGVSREAQHAYEHARVFAEDPFTRLVEDMDHGGRMVRWNDAALAVAAGKSVTYRDFLNHFAVEVVGAFVQQLLPDLFLVVGTHCRPGVHRIADVEHRLLEREVQAIARMVVGQVLQRTLTSGAGHRLLDDLLKPVPAEAPSSGPPRLSRRECDIADLVCAGKQNKQVAYALSLSEFTVENHLRRIYRKLGVHNRAGMATALLRATPSIDGYPSLGRARAAA